MNENEKYKKRTLDQHEIIQIDDSTDDELAMMLQIEEIEKSQRQNQSSQIKGKISCSSVIDGGETVQIDVPEVYNVESEFDSNVMDDIIEIPSSSRLLTLPSRKLCSNDSSDFETSKLILNQSKPFQEANESAILQQTEHFDAQLAMFLQLEEEQQLAECQKQQYTDNNLSKLNSSSSSSSSTNQHRSGNGYYYNDNNQRIFGSSSASSSTPPLETYEELSGLQEIIGFVHTGAKSQEEIDSQSCKYVVMNNNKNERNQLEKNDGACIICLCKLEIGQHARILQCFHSFHQKCIDEWLYQKKECPVCKHKLN